MAPEIQSKFLRVLDSGTFYRVGATRKRRADFRLVAATNRDLAAEVAAGRFRKDLFYRIHGVKVVIPPLRDRPEDIPLLVEHFARQLPVPKRFSAGRAGTRSPPTTGRATCASCTSRWSAPASCPRATASGWRTCRPRSSSARVSARPRAGGRASGPGDARDAAPAARPRSFGPVPSAHRLPPPAPPRTRGAVGGRGRRLQPERARRRPRARGAREEPLASGAGRRAARRFPADPLPLDEAPRPVSRAGRVALRQTGKPSAASSSSSLGSSAPWLRTRCLTRSDSSRASSVPPPRANRSTTARS